MTQTKFNRPHQRYWLLFIRLSLILALCFICFGSVKANIDTGVQVSDKFLHFFAYVILTGLVAAAFPAMNIIKVFLITSIFGGAMEGLQHIAPTGRQSSILDQIANMSGAFCAILIWCAAVIIWHLVFPKTTKSLLNSS